MSRQVTTTQLWESIRNAGLASEEDCRKWAKGVNDGLGKGVAGDPDQLIAALVKFGYLTPYQGNVIFHAHSHPLLLEGIRIDRSLEDSLGPHWYEGRTIRRSSDTDRATSERRVWVAALSMETISDPAIKAWPPSKIWAEQHAPVDHPQLDHWLSVGATLRHLYATVEPWNSPSLSQTLQAGKLHTENGLQMVRDVAKGLHALHQAGLVHGNLSLDAILANPEGGFLVRRDPLFPPRSPYHAKSLSLIQHSHPLLAVAAPELCNPESLPSAQSDLYALGCIWFRCITGHWPVEPAEGASAIAWGALHAKIPIQPTSNMSERAGKCLLHLLAKSPTARFASAHAFLRALNTDPILSTGTYPSETRPTVPAAVNEPSAEYVVNKAPGDSNPKSENTPVQKPQTPKPKQEIPSLDTSSVNPAEPQDVQKIAAELRDKKIKIGQRNPARSSTVNTTPIAPNLPTPDKTSAQSVVQQETEPTSVPPDAPTIEPQPKKKKKKRPAGPGAKSGTKSRGKNKQGRPFWVMPALIVGSCIFLVGMVLILRRQTTGVVTISSNPTKTTKNVAPQEPKSNKAIDGANTAADPLAERFDIQPDDGKMPWAPPTARPAYASDLLPMGVEALVLLSPRAWQSEGPIAPLVAWWKSIEPDRPNGWWRSLPIPTDPIDHVAFAWCPSSVPNNPRYAVRFAFKEPRKVSELFDLTGWSAKAINNKDLGTSGSIWVRNEGLEPQGVACDELASSADQLTRYLTFGPPDLLESILASQSIKAVMRPQMDALRQASDSSSDLTLLLAPSFLFGDAKEVLGPDSPRLLEFLREVIDTKTQAIMIRAQWDKNWYLEWRSLGSDLQAAARNAAEMKSKVESVSNQLESALVTQPADPYWRAIANRFPQMLRSLTKWMRTGAEGGQAIVNAYLPEQAVTNLAIGAWMAAQRDWNTVASSPTSKKPTTPEKSIEQWLDTPISIRIDQDSVENVLQAIAKELKEASGMPVEPIPMSINGPAFQKDGITRNQQVRKFEFKNAPVREVLTTLVRRVNPVTTVQAPNEKDQKVLWIVLEDPSSPSKNKLQITTRAWSEANSASIPKEFVLAGN